MSATVEYSRSIQAPGVTLISGVPGAGKTTVAGLLARRFLRAVHIEGDLIGHQFIVSGLVSPESEPREEAERQLALRRKNICLLADSYVEAGFDVFVDDVVVSRRPLEVYQDQLRARPLRFVQFTPHLEQVRARDEARDKHVFEIWSHLDSQLRAWPDPRPGLWIDTSSLTPDQTVEEILARLAEAELSRPRGRRSSTAQSS